MAEINLLANQNTNSSAPQLALSILVKAGGAVLVLLLLFYGYLFWSGHSLKSAIEQETAAIKAAQAEILASTDRKELITRQSQSEQVNKLIAAHTFWSRFFPDIARSTLQTAKYSSIATLADGKVELNLNVPNYQALDAYLQVFDQPEFNKNFNNFKIISVTKSQTPGSTSLDVRLTFEYDTKSLIETIK